MAVRNRQIGWSPMANALYDVLREFNALKGQFAAPTTTTTTTAATLSTVSVPLSADPWVATGLFDIPITGQSVGFWMKVSSVAGSINNTSTIFNIGYDSSVGLGYQTLYINRLTNELCFIYGYGSVEIVYSLSSYLDQWVWVGLTGGGGEIKLWINGVDVAVASGILPPAEYPLLPVTFGNDFDANHSFNGLIADFICEVAGGDWDVAFVPSSPIVSTSAMLHMFQGTDLTQQLTDSGMFLLNPTVGTNVVYNADSPYIGYNGSTQFGTI